MSNEPVAWDRGTWTVGETESQEFIESSDFNHDVRLYLNGDFEDNTQRLNYLKHIADRLNAHPVTEHFEDEPQAEELHEIMQSNAELTDEEIWELAKEIGWKEVMIPLIIPLGRAILRKAQEK